MFHWIATISYLGKNFFGSQKQKEKISIQEDIEQALKKIFQKTISVEFCGRTDSGVNAFAQSISFNLTTEIDKKKLIQSLNCLTNNDISILHLIQTTNKIHARFDCIAKSYSYLFYTGQQHTYIKDFFYRLKSNFFEELAEKACQIFYGKNDFSAIIVNNHTQQKAHRNILLSKLIKINNSSYAFVICADGFIYKMIRSLTGLLFSIAQKNISLKELTEIIQYNNPKQLKLPIAPAQGLSFFEAYYNKKDLTEFLAYSDTQLKQKIIDKILP